jgi:hypothetical protein
MIWICVILLYDVATLASRRQETGGQNGTSRRKKEREGRKKTREGEWRLVKEGKREGRRRDNGEGSIMEKETEEGGLGAD